MVVGNLYSLVYHSRLFQQIDTPMKAHETNVSVPLVKLLINMYLTRHQRHMILFANPKRYREKYVYLQK